MPVGKCPMCLRDNRQLACSHLMPAALYETCRSEHSEPIKVSSEIVMATSRQTQDYLLCAGRDGCEQALDQGGEKWTLPMLMDKDRRSPLYEILRTATPLFVDGDVRAYAASTIPRIEVAKLTHFTMGIFWKASVHGWMKKRGKPRINLGRYSEAIRKYLLGEIGFPDGLALSVHVGVPEKAMISFSDPVTGKDKHAHFFYVPGVMFSLMVSERKVTEEMKLGCFASNVHHPIMISEGIKGLFEWHSQKQYFGARKAKNVVETLKALNKSV
jgi:hypothetical protein